MRKVLPGMDSSMRAIRFDRYGDVEELKVEEVPKPSATDGRVVIEVRAAGTNPGEAAIRKGLMDAQFPATFPSGQGTDLAGVVTEVGPGVSGFAVGDEVLGWSDERASHAEYVSAPAEQLTPKPPAVPWEVAGSLYVAGLAAYGAVQAIAPVAGQTVVVSGASGGVGLIALQLVRNRDVRVLAVSSVDSQREVEQFGADLVAYGDDLTDRLRRAAPDGIDGWIDLFGDGYVDIALELGVVPEKINTIIDFVAAQQQEGVQIQGTQSVASAQNLAELAGMVADGRVQVPITATYTFEQVQDAYTELEARHTHGKIVLVP